MSAEFDQHQVRLVAANDWLAEVSLARSQGFDWFDSLHAIDEIGRPTTLGVEQVRVVVRLWRWSEQFRETLELHTRIRRLEGELASLGSVFAGAVWHEREAHDFFGVRFIGGDDRPLLWHQPAGVRALRPLLKDAVLVSRAGVAWPGAKDPEVNQRAQGSRRRTLPVGVPDPEVWGPQVVGEPSADEVAAAVSGSRVRRRR